MNEQPQGESPQTESPQSEGTQQQPAWSAKFKDPGQMYEAYRKLQSETDRLRSQSQPSAQPQQAQAQQQPQGSTQPESQNDSESVSLAEQIEAEFGQGQLTDGTRQRLEGLGFDPEAVMNFVKYQNEQSLAPLAQYFPGDDLNQVLEGASQRLQGNQREMFRELVKGQQYEAAAAIIRSAMSQPAPQQPQVGSVNASAGFNKDEYLRMDLQRLRTDPVYRQQMEHKHAMTPPSLIEEWEQGR